MKIDELIDELEAVREEHSNLEVRGIENVPSDIIVEHIDSGICVTTE